MTPLQEYRQAKNNQARKYGGSFICPGCGGDIEYLPKTDRYLCAPCDWAWDKDGNEIKEAPNA